MILFSNYIRDYTLGLGNLINEYNNIYIRHSARFTSACPSKFFWYIFCIVSYSLVANGGNPIYMYNRCYSFGISFLHLRTEHSGCAQLCSLVTMTVSFGLGTPHANSVGILHRGTIGVYNAYEFLPHGSLSFLSANVCKCFGNKK